MSIHKTMILPVCLGILLVGIVMIPGVFAEVDYSQISLDQSSVQVIEFGNYNLVRTHLSLTNNDNEEFSTYNYFLKTDENTYYDNSDDYKKFVNSFELTTR